MNWEPIETAPEEQDIWVWGNEWRGERVVLGRFDRKRLEILETYEIVADTDEVSDRFFDSGGGGWPTHWCEMNRPSPPTSTPATTS